MPQLLDRSPSRPDIVTLNVQMSLRPKLRALDVLAREYHYPLTLHVQESGPLIIQAVHPLPHHPGPRKGRWRVRHPALQGPSPACHQPQGPPHRAHARLVCPSKRGRFPIPRNPLASQLRNLNNTFQAALPSSPPGADGAPPQYPMVTTALYAAATPAYGPPTPSQPVPSAVPPAMVVPLPPLYGGSPP